MPDPEQLSDRERRELLVQDTMGPNQRGVWNDLKAERDRLRVENEALKANQCPDAEVCKTCPCATEDDACFPGERLRAENERLRDAAELAVQGCLPILPLKGAWGSGYKVEEKIGHTLVALPEEWAEAAHGIACLHNSLTHRPLEPPKSRRAADEEEAHRG